ncbi:MAG: DUF3365 domain-containing protein [Bacteroidia bacterium]|nr:DUF3365 domain-containing protein [Bacteroidia bacterium]
MFDGKVGLLLLFLIACAPSHPPASPPSQTLSVEEDSTFRMWQYIGDSLSTERQQSVFQALLKASERAGWAGAVRYCSQVAESLSSHRESRLILQRVAFRNRNPRNRLIDSLDTVAYNYFAQTRDPKSYVLRASKGTLRYYRPIYITVETCLKCHGLPESIDGPALAEIRRRYPGDRATGFTLGELRGMWRMEIVP